MYLETVDKFTDLAAKKVKHQKKSPSGFFFGAMMAGACVALTVGVMGNGNQTAKTTSDIFFIGATYWKASQPSIAETAEPGDAKGKATALKMG